jgi:outer membrane lipoprotein-sorting protein
MNMLRALLPLAFIACAAPALADKIPLKDISAYLNSLTTADTDFTQVNADGSVSTGKLFIQRPGRARFEYAPLKRTPLNLILASNIDLAQAKMVVAHSEDKNATKVVAQDPQHPEYGTIALVFTANPMALRQWVITDDLGQQTTVILGEMHKGANYKPSTFSIDIESKKRGL